jgi:hypothetical protein
MAILSFTLSPEAVGRFYDSLVCLGKFSESVTIEAMKDRVRTDAWCGVQRFADIKIVSTDCVEFDEIGVCILHLGW